MSARARSREGASPRFTRMTSRRSLAGMARRSILPGHYPVRDRTQMPRTQAGIPQRLMRTVETFIGQLTRLRNSIQRHVRRFRAGGVLARRLPQLLGAPFDIEHIVDDLE